METLNTEVPSPKIPQIMTLDELIQELHRIFESNSVNVEYVRDVMVAYKSNPKEWKQYAKFDRHRYTRNLVDEGNGKFNLMVLAWSEGQGSSIHDHSNCHCFMKQLSGCLTEVRYDWPSENEQMQPIGETDLKANEVAYINDSLGLHRVENRSHTEAAVSLHLYCPPFDSCRMFDQRTGHQTVSKVTFWSKYGEKTPYFQNITMTTTNSSDKITVYENN
ncbi:cysteine dioxygenase type 1-like [Limulus polyphemus]|uniref:Cysteine dioxygenase n=1 Tax=Limulus polyphemus TaxID=6850 RepID=A0ABM1BTC7_LIMPO|nr:cysteine dioxygenase type 1-like [Limulus polyphemus]